MRIKWLLTAGLVVTFGALIAAVAVLAVSDGSDGPTSVASDAADRADASDPVLVSSLNDSRSAGDAANQVAIHGSWVLTVSEADGTFVKRYEFDNAFMPSGAEWLAGLFAKEVPLVFYWRVALISDQAVCTTPNVINQVGMTGGWVCNFGELNGLGASSASAGPLHNSNITIATNSGSFQLSGSLTMDEDGEINRVATWVVEQASTPTCNNDGTCLVHEFTLADAPNFGSVPVFAGQVVQVEVDIAFVDAP